MDGWGIGILIVSFLLWFITKRKHGFFLFTAGIGAGLIIGAIWAMSIINSAFGSLF